MLITGLKSSFLEGLQKTVEQEQILVFRVIWHHDHHTDDPEVHRVELLVRLAVDLDQLCDASFDQGIGLGDQVVGQGNLAEVEVELELERSFLKDGNRYVAEGDSSLEKGD